MARKRTTAAAAEKQMSALAAARKAFDDFRPAAEVLRSVRAVPTRFVQLDHATKVGGLPIERFMLLHGPSGEGKALPVDGPVLTPRGFIPIGILKVGDRVIGLDGKPHVVLGVYDRGEREVFKVTLSDGSIVECCDEHLWQTRTTNERTRGKFVRGPCPERSRIPTGAEGVGSVKTLAQIRASLDAEHEVPALSPVEFDPVGDLAVDPYLLGVFLGDGGFTSSYVGIHNPEHDIREVVAKLLPDGDELREIDEVSMRVVGGRFAKELAKLGLRGKRSFEKHVPDQYLHASREDRLSLLRGLLDTDGHVTKDGLYEFTTTSPALYDAVLFLVRSLGGYARVQPPRRTRYTHNGEVRVGRESRRVLIRFGCGVVPVASKKHLARVKATKPARRTIETVELSRIARCVCIAVDAPDRLYIANDFVPTHNTYFSLGLIESFLRLDHFAQLIDAERTTPIDWAELIMGEIARHPGFFAMRPDTYEECVEQTRKWLLRIKAQRDAKKVPPGTSGLVVCDSVRKLVPKDIFAKIAGEAAKGQKKARGIDGMGGRAAQIKAAMNAQWMDELVPLLEKTGTAFLAIARESDDPDADMMAKAYGRAFKVGGGKALYYDSSLVFRVERDRWVTDAGDDEGKNKTVFGERHRVTIRKTKVAGHEKRETVCYFHTSNGVLTPAGFDRARDVVDLGERFGVVERKGSWYAVKGGDKLGQGVNGAVKKLAEDPAALDSLESIVRSQFAVNAPVEHDEDGVVLS
jgi:RecA/RadA recombinase